MSQQTQPQQKQPDSLRRGVLSGVSNIISRANIQNNSSGLSFERTAASEANDFDFFELNYETK